MGQRAAEQQRSGAPQGGCPVRSCPRSGRRSTTEVTPPVASPEGGTKVQQERRGDTAPQAEGRGPVVGRRPYVAGQRWSERKSPGFPRALAPTRLLVKWAISREGSVPGETPIPLSF